MLDIVFSGCPGVGKTTLIQQIKEKRPEFGCVQEELPEDIASLLAKVYKGEENVFFNGLKLQIALFGRALKNSGGNGTGRPMRVCERSFRDAKYFIRPMAEFGLLDEDSFKSLSNLVRQTEAACSSRCKTVRILLDADPVILHKRINQRGRPGEERITQKYLKALREAHKKDSWDACVDASQDLEGVVADTLSLLDHFKRTYGPCPYHGCVLGDSSGDEEEEGEIKSPPFSPLVKSHIK